MGNLSCCKRKEDIEKSQPSHSEVGSDVIIINLNPPPKYLEPFPAPSQPEFLI